MSIYGFKQDLVDGDYFELIILRWLQHYYKSLDWDKTEGKFKPYDIYSKTRSKPTLEVKFSRAIWNLVFTKPDLTHTESDIWVHGVLGNSGFKSQAFAFITPELRAWVFAQHKRGLIKSAKRSGDFNEFKFSIPMEDLRKQPFCQTFNLRESFNLLEWASNRLDF